PLYPAHFSDATPIHPFMSRGLEPSTDQSRPEKVVLRGTSDVDRLIAYLLSHIKPPRIEVCIDEISESETARAQHDLRLYSEKCKDRKSTRLNSSHVK